MIKPLEHPFLYRCINFDRLLGGCKKFNSYANRLETQALEKATMPDGEIDVDIQNKYKGDGFELFVEFFIKMFGANPLVQIDPSSYQVNLEEDFGVDGHGVGDNGKVHTVQVKYRAANAVLTANGDNLTNFTNDSCIVPIEEGGFGVDSNYRCPNGHERVKGKSNMTIVHCGKEIRYDSKSRMLPTVREIKRSDIKYLTQNNNIFWNSFEESVKNALENINVKTK